MTRELKPCGTLAAHLRHRRHGEEPCPPCRRAWADYAAQRRDLNSKNVPEHVHGTPGGYTNYLCRCRPCREAWREQMRRTMGYQTAAAR